MLGAIFVLGFFIIFSIYQHKNKKSPFDLDCETLNPENKNYKNPVVFALIDKINDKNNRIYNIYVKQMPIWLTINNITFKARGELAHQKDKLFRLHINTIITGKEMDLGSNNDIFWFWSKRMEPSYLYYSRHENISKTNLKTPLNPMWMIESLNFNLIDKGTIQAMIEKNEMYYIYQNRTSASGEPIILITILDPKSESVIGRLMLNQIKENIVTITYKNKSMKTIWHNEAISMEWDMSSICYNTELPGKLWILPDYKNKFDIGK